MKKYKVVSSVVVLGAVIALMSAKREKGSPSGPGTSDVSQVSTRAAGGSMSGTESGTGGGGSTDAVVTKWYEQLLEKHPEMKPVYRDVPDEENGYLQLCLLADKVGKPRLPDDLWDMIFLADGEWDAGKFKAWQMENQDYFDEVLRIAELKERSAKGIAFDRVFGGLARLGKEFSGILNAAARMAFESGDRESALRYLKASTSIGDHLVDTEVPCMLGEVISVGNRNHARNSFRENFLPSLANDPEALGRWEKVLFREEKPADEFARVIAGEWNTSVRSFLLPALLEDSPGDAERAIESYTGTLRKSAEGVLRSGSDRFDSKEAASAFPQPGEAAGEGRKVSVGGMLKSLWQSAEGIFQQGGGRFVPKEDAKPTAEGMLVSMRSLSESFGKNATRTAMDSAAIAILRGKVPPVDPVSGAAFVWDAETRTLSAPGGGEEFDPVVVPGGN